MRRGLAAAFVLLVILLIFAWSKLSYKPVLVAGPPVGAKLVGVPTAGWPREAGARLHVFNTGMVRMSSLLVGASSRWRPAPAFVVEHPRRGLILYDCGMSLEVAQRGEAVLPPLLRLFVDVRARPERVLDAQMRAAGLDPARVGTVIVSHDHFDHVGRAGAFPQATFVGGAGIRKNHRGERTALVPDPLDWIAPARFQEVSFQGAPPYATFDGGRDLFGDQSVLLLRGEGHTLEDLLTLVPLPRGPVLLTGDAVEDRAWLNGDDVQRVPDLPERAAAVRNQVRALLRADPGVLLVPGHELAHLPTDRPDVVLHHPEWFAMDAWPAS